MDYKRTFVKTILDAISAEHHLLQIIIGPRQVGKTTAALQIQAEWPGPSVYASADAPLPPGPEWIQHHWDVARRKPGHGTLLILDETQKVRGWSESIKSLWDEDKRNQNSFSVLLLGSSSLLIQKGLSESLSGRFMLHHCNHWSYAETSDAFGLTFDEWLYFGGYPGAIALKDDNAAWKSYILNSLIETVLNKDIIQMQTIAKPALFRHLFLLATQYPAEILSYNKMLGQLQDAGNTTTLAHYLRLLSSAFLISGLELYKIGDRPKRGSSPKLIIRNNALISALSSKSPGVIIDDPAYRGRLIENAVGAHLLNCFNDIAADVYYWRKGNMEVDYVISTPETTLALEVKSGRMKHARGLETFLNLKKNARPAIIGSTGIPLETFLQSDPKELLL
ncbi:MAG: ATP-binding protein [Deltaproteobacteria bacterium]|nr:ATP-binding protein [Deltaproteobacteria bacterium]